MGIIRAFQAVDSSAVVFSLAIRKIFMEVEVGRKNPSCSSSRGSLTPRSLILKPSRSKTSCQYRTVFLVTHSTNRRR